jgi:hypothetical protein
MTDERHKEWLAGLKKGDEAVIERIKMQLIMEVDGND